MSGLRAQAESHWNRLGWTAVGLFLALAAAQFALRGPVDAGGRFNLCDFANQYASARLWLIGDNPYDRAALPIAWQASGPGAADVPMAEWYGLLPPGAFAMFWPVAAIPAGFALAAWMVLSVVSVVVILYGAMVLADLPARSLKGMLLISGTLACAPLQMLLSVGQCSLVVVTMLVGVMCCARSGRSAWAGLLLGAAAAIKPQFAAPFGLYYLAYRQWKLAGFAVTTCLVLNLIGITQLEWRSVPWWTDWLENMFASTSPGHANDPRLGAPLRHQMINLTVLINAFFLDRSMVRAVNLLAVLGLAGSYIWMIRRCRLSADSLLSLSILCGLTLLPVYHRAYDAAILVIAYGWALGALGGPLRPAAWATLAAMALLLVPFDLLMLMNRKLGMFDDASHTWFWQAIIAPHHAWAALATSICLLGALRLRLAQLSPADQDPEEMRFLPQLQLDQRALETADRWLASTRTT